MKRLEIQQWTVIHLPFSRTARRSVPALLDGGEVVDLGTRFGVDASAADSTGVVVIEGSVEPRSKRGGVNHLAEGEGVVVNTWGTIGKLDQARFNPRTGQWSRGALDEGSSLIRSVRNNQKDQSVYHIVAGGLVEGLVPTGERIGKVSIEQHRENKQAIYYKPRPGEDMAAATIEAPVLERLIQLTGTSSSTSNKVRDVRFEGLTFTQTGWNGPSEKGSAMTQGARALVQPYAKHGAITAQDADNVDIAFCKFRFLGFSAISYVKGVTGGSMRNCGFNRLSGNGIVIHDNKVTFMLTRASTASGNSVVASRENPTLAAPALEFARVVLDTDGDGYEDAFETANGSNPSSASSIPLKITGAAFQAGVFAVPASGLSPTIPYVLRRSANLSDGFPVTIGAPFYVTDPPSIRSDPEPPPGKAFYRIEPFR